MKKKMSSSLNILALLAGTYITQSVFAGTMGSAASWNYVATLSAGAAWQNAGTTQTFFLTPAIEKTYAADKAVSGLGTIGAFLGMQYTFTPIFQGQLGAEVGTTTNAKLSGEIWDDADPLFNNYTYTYNVQQTRIALKGKLQAKTLYAIIPWVSGSVGLGFNRAHTFTNQPTIFEAVANPNFGANNTTSFTYTVGAGIQRELTKNWQIGVGYEFADWGNSRLDEAPQQTIGKGLALNHLYTNGVLFNLTYIA